MRAAVAERSWNSFTLAGTYDKVRADDEPDLSGALSRLVAEAGQPDIVISALPRTALPNNCLNCLSKMRAGCIRRSPSHSKNICPSRWTTPRLPFARAGRNGDSTLVMAAMVRKTDLQHHLDLLQKAGLDPKTVTLAPLALAAMYTRDHNGAANGAKPTAHLVVEGDEASTSVVLVDWAARARLAFGERRPDDVRGAVVSQEVAAPILNSVRQTLLAHSEELDQTEVIVAGAAATYPKVRGMLSESLAMSVRDGGAFDYTGLFEGTVPNTGRYSSCVAMLLGELPASRSSDQFSPGRIPVPRTRSWRPESFLHVWNSRCRAAGGDYYLFRARVSANLHRLARSMHKSPPWPVPCWVRPIPPTPSRS